MENCVIYSHNLAFDKVVDIVKKHLPLASVEVQDGGKQKALTATIKGGFFSKSKVLKINYRERENPSWKLDKIECGLTQNLAGMANFIGSIPAQNTAIRDKLIYKVMSVNCEMPFMAEPGFDDTFQSILREIAGALDAFIFAQPGNVFNKSDTQHFADPAFQLILDVNGKSGVNDISVQIDTKYADEPQDYSPEQLERKNASEKWLNEHGIPVNSHLPCQPDSGQVKIRSVAEVVERAYALVAIAAKGEGVEQQNLNRGISEKRITGFTPAETQILQSESLTDQERANATWRYESLQTLLWALGMMPQLDYPDSICDVTAVVSTIFKPSREEFESNVRLRTAAEILDETDKIYRMHWACVNARISGKPAPGNLQSGVVYERHYALNWLTCNMDLDWDDVQTNT